MSEDGEQPRCRARYTGHSDQTVEFDTFTVLTAVPAVSAPVAERVMDTQGGR